jgi:polyribonucleotide nucleotidyltransferase
MTISKNKNVRSVSREIGGRTLTIETGWIAKQASASVLVSYGETAVISTVVDGGPRLLPFFPLTVEYREKTYAAGKIPGGFFKREGRPDTREVLACRLTDRSVRPMFTEGYKNEVQLMNMVLSYDQENEPEVLAMIGSMAVLALADIPWDGTMAAVRLGWIDGNVIVNPTYSILEDEANKLDLIMSATRDAVVMVEAGARELPDSEVVKVLAAGHDVCREIIGMVEDLRTQCGKPKRSVEPPAKDLATPAAIRARYPDAAMRKVLLTKGKHERYAALAAFTEQCVKDLAPAGEDEASKAAQETVRKASAWTAAISRRCARSRSKPACCRARTAPRCSRAARPRPSSPRRWARPTTSSSSTACARSGARTASCCTTTSRLTPPAKRSRSAAPRGGRSGTARSPSVRCARCCRTTATSPTRYGSSPRSPSRTALPRWLRSAAHRSR